MLLSGKFTPFLVENNTATGDGRVGEKGQEGSHSVLLRRVSSNGRAEKDDENEGTNGVVRCCTTEYNSVVFWYTQLRLRLYNYTSSSAQQ